MLTIDHPARDIPAFEYFDNQKQEFVSVPAMHIDPIHLLLEHSLRSIAKWESKWHTSFVGTDQLTGEELLDYIRCMTTNQNKNPQAYDYLTQEDLNIIVLYMKDEQSAWKIKPPKTKQKTKNSDTAEMFYYAMVQYGIPLECENWHFNRLLAFIDFCGSKGGSTPGGGSPAKRSEREIMEMYRALNEKNRKKYHSKG